MISIGGCHRNRVLESLKYLNIPLSFNFNRLCIVGMHCVTICSLSKMNQRCFGSFKEMTIKNIGELLFCKLIQVYFLWEIKSKC